MFKKFLKESYGLIWTIAGSAMVLITLSGSVLQKAIWITGIALIVHYIGAIFTKEDENE